MALWRLPVVLLLLCCLSDIQVVRGEDEFDMRGPQYDTQESCDVNCVIGAPCIAWCGCAPEKDNQGFYTCIPCSPEQLQACADSEERERLIRQNVARLEAKRARDAHEAAQVELDAALSRAVQQGMASLAAAGTSLASNALAPAPESCDRVVRGGVDGCKQGVRAQVAYCNNKVRAEVDKCKKRQKTAIDRCKKQNRLSPWLCELGRPGIPICEANRINIPLCELDRATATCCETARGAAKAQCRIAGPANVQTLIQAFQIACSVATSVAKSALKSYATGAVLGFVSDVAQIQEVVETVQKVQDIKKKADAAQQAAEGIAAAAEGNVGAAVSALQGVATVFGDIKIGQAASNLASSAANTLAVVESLPVLLEGKLNAAVLDAVGSVTESKVVREGLATVNTLKTKVEAGIKTIEELRAAVDECRSARIPTTEELQAEFGAPILTVEDVQAFVVKVQERC